MTADSWGSSEIEMAEALLPHIRQFVPVQQALQRAEARETGVTALLDHRRIGVLRLDRRRQIMAANDRARHILRQGTVLSDQDGALRTRERSDQIRLERLVTDSLPASRAVLAGGRSERAQYGQRYAAHDGLRVLAAEADLLEPAHLQTGELGAVGAVDGRVRITAELPVFSAGRAFGARPLAF